MDWILVKDGKVVNIIVADQAFIDAIQGQYDLIIPRDESHNYSPGDDFTVI